MAARIQAGRNALWAALPLVALFASGCGHHVKVSQRPPQETAPAAQQRSTASSDAAGNGAAPRRIPITPVPPGGVSADDLAFIKAHRPILSEEGLATWYASPYKGRKAANGQVFDDHALTAAHRTLPMGSTVRVTNLSTGQQVLVRITDRGPFSPGRVLDLSMGAAKAIGVYRMGVAQVKIEAFAHTTADPAGKWCVQTGGFKSQDDALALKAKLLRRYSTAKVIEFAGPTGYWVRIDPPTRSKTQANEIAEWIGEPKPATLPYVVRLD